MESLGLFIMPIYLCCLNNQAALFMYTIFDKIRKFVLQNIKELYRYLRKSLVIFSVECLIFSLYQSKITLWERVRKS